MYNYIQPKKLWYQQLLICVVFGIEERSAGVVWNICPVLVCEGGKGDSTVTAGKFRSERKKGVKIQAV